MKFSIQTAATTAALLLSVYSLQTANDGDFLEGSYDVAHKVNGYVMGTLIPNGRHIEAGEIIELPEQVHSIEEAQQPARPIFNLIGLTEGTDRGDGYNETLAYGAYTEGDVNLIAMTLAEIDALQTKMLKHEDNDLNSSAIGRYQITRTTLRSLKITMALADTQKFTAELQDLLAVELLNGRGYSTWKIGQISDRAFALNLAKEWASLPNPETGKGYYSGQNAAVSYETVKAVLDQVRSESDSSENSALAHKGHTATLSASKSVNGPINLEGQIDVANFNEWAIEADAEYSFGTDSFKFGGTATYEFENMSVSLGGTYDTQDNTEFQGSLTFKF